MTDRSNNSAFKRRMVLMSALPLLALIATIVIALFELQRVNAGVDRIYADRVVPLSQLKQIADDYAVKVVEAVNKANAGRYSAAELSSDLDAAKTNIAARWDEFMATELTAEETRLAAEAKALSKVADARVTELQRFAAAMTGPTAGALAQFDGPLYDVIDPISAKITELIDLQLRVASEERETAWAVFNESLWILTILGAAVAVVLGWMGIQTYRRMLEPLAVADAMHAVAENADLRVRAHSQGDIADAFNRLMQQFQELVGQVGSGSEELSTAAQQMSAIVHDTAAGANRQRDQSGQVATAINQLTTSVEEIARNTAHAADAGNEARDVAREGANRVSEVSRTITELVDEIQQAAASLDELNSQTNSISTVLDVIRGIAEQTNLLALNAAIEAARAGEQGRGFAVVADEVRTLAQRTQSSTIEIESMVDKLQRSADRASGAMGRSKSKVDDSADVVTRAGDALTQITGSADMVGNLTMQIATMTEEQRSVVEEINQTIVAINDAAAAAATGAEQAATASEQMARTADRFRQQAAVFKT